MYLVRYSSSLRNKDSSHTLLVPGLFTLLNGFQCAVVWSSLKSDAEDRFM